MNRLMDKVEKVLKKLNQYRVKVNWEKCKWFVPEVQYLGHKLSKKGVEPNYEKIRAISELPPPKNVSQLKSFIGMIIFYSKFLSHLASLLKPLYVLLKKGSKWMWNESHEKCFHNCKKAILNAKILEHYDPKKQMVIVCDASDDGIAAILCHIVNGVEKPVFFVSRVVSKAEKTYPILHREALAIIFGLEKFYKYIFGHHVTVFSDHKPLERIFNRKTPIKMGIFANRIQRY
jgi:hypothetical protein